MNNPYEILNVKQSASKEEIKKAYRDLAKQYHPDQYGNNPLKNLAEEKMREINEAYDTLMKDNQSSTNNNTNNNSYNNSYETNSSGDYNYIRSDINSGKYKDAQIKLNNISNRNGEWNFLYGILSLRKGWYDEALTYLDRACKLEPNNLEYRRALDEIRRTNTSYRGNYYGSKGNDDICQVCSSLYCLDCCCESMGGDFIPCC
ncbi:MAG: DnaJ domain-containing protein [Clostridiaceae bacterium]